MKRSRRPLGAATDVSHHMKPTSLPGVFCRTVHAISETPTYIAAKVLGEYSRIFFSWLRLDDARRSPAATQSCMPLQARQGLASLWSNTGRIESNEVVCELGALRSNGFGWFCRDLCRHRCKAYCPLMMLQLWPKSGASCRMFNPRLTARPQETGDTLDTARDVDQLNLVERCFEVSSCKCKHLK